MANKKFSIRPVGPIGSNLMTGSINYDLLVSQTSDHFIFEIDLSTIRGAGAKAALQSYLETVVGVGNVLVTGVGWTSTPGTESEFDVELVGDFANIGGTITSVDGISMPDAQDVWLDDPSYSVTDDTRLYDMDAYVGGQISVDGEFFDYNFASVDTGPFQDFLDTNYPGFTVAQVDNTNSFTITGTGTFPVIHSSDLLLLWSSITVVNLQNNAPPSGGGFSPPSNPENNLSLGDTMIQVVSEIVEARNVSNLAQNTATAVSSTKTNLQRGVIVKSSPDNTGPVLVGLRNVTTSGKGFAVYPGEAQLFPVSDASQLFVSDTVGNQAISFLLL